MEKRASRGLTWLFSYAFSKALSDATGFVGGGPYDTGNRIQDMFNKKADKAVASQDHRHRASLATIYELPFGPGKALLSGAPKIASKIVGGWAVNGIYTYQTGLPLTVKFNGDVFGSGTDNARPDRFATRTWRPASALSTDSSPRIVSRFRVRSDLVLPAARR